MTRTHTHPCRYCHTPLPCHGEPDYACGTEGAFCADEAQYFPDGAVCDECALIQWCEWCGEVEAVPGYTKCPVCFAEDESLD